MEYKAFCTNIESYISIAAIFHKKDGKLCFNHYEMFPPFFSPVCVQFQKENTLHTLCKLVVGTYIAIAALVLHDFRDFLRGQNQRHGQYIDKCINI